MNPHPPHVYVCDVHTCIHNNGEGDCQRSSVPIGDDGKCSQLKERDKE